MAERVDPFAALRTRNYLLFAFGFLFSSTALQMLATAILWEVSDHGTRLMAVGFAGLARALPVVLLAPISGQVADLYSRKWLLVLTQGGFVLCALGLAAASFYHASLWVFYVLLVCTGICRSFNGPSRNSLLPQLVDLKTLQSAVSWTQGLFQASAIGGPILAGVLMARSGLTWPVYVVTAVGCGVFAVTTVFVAPRDHRLGKKAEAISVASLLAGAQFMGREKAILGAITLDLLAVLFAGATALLPHYSEHVFGGGEVALGWLKAAPFIGSLVVAMYMTTRPPFKRAGPTLLWSVVGYGVCTIVFGLSQSFIVAFIALVVSGGFDNISVIVRHMLVQVRTPDHLRGRVSAVNSLFIECSNELGALESAAVAKVWNPVASVVGGGLMAIVVVMGVAAGIPQLRKLGELHPKKPDPSVP